MSRRMWALVVGGVVAIGAVIAGSLIAISQDSDSLATPSGDANELRLEAVNGEVSCGRVAAVRLYLDDLEFHESTRAAGVPLGMIGFELPVQYDPNVLRILNSKDIQLNQDLGQQDVDGDGLVREFFTVAELKFDHLGRAVIGAGSIVPASQSLEDNLEEGVDPVSKGEPLLLMTVRFTPVGEGTTTVRLEPIDSPGGEIDLRVFDPDRGKYKPLSVKDARITVRGGDCPQPPPSPTPVLTSTPFVAPTQTPIRWETVEPVDALSAGRSDCPQEWVVYTDSQDRFSVCYPADFDATASDVSVNLGPRNGDASIGFGLSVVMYWDPTPGTVYFPPNEENCAMELTLGERLSTGVVDLPIGDEAVPACFTQSQEAGSSSILGSLRTAVPLSRDGSAGSGYVQIHIGFSGAGIDQIPDLVRTIVRTLLVSRS